MLMSSSSAMFDYPPKRKAHTEEDWNNTTEAAITDRSVMDGLDPWTRGLLTYASSKTTSERAFWKFREDKKPAFGMPAIQGR